jgi:predicted helicase
VYAVLHNPAYREKYALHLKREFPRIPLYKDFWRWTEWGRKLMEMHVNFESVARWGLERKDKIYGLFDTKKLPKTILKADKSEGKIVLDEQTTLAGVPELAWEYRLGSRSALEWILDQYKEKKPNDPTLRKMTETGQLKAYRFSDYKEKVIELLDKVCRVSVETMEIVRQMREAEK